MAAERGSSSKRARVLFVCLGNICRSPLAEGVFRHLVREAGLDDAFEIESAGLGPWHVGKPPDPRACAVATRRGVALDGKVARQVAPSDFERFDVILAMDRANHEHLVELAPAAARSRVCMLRDFDPEGGGDVPDPYYGGPEGFDRVFDMVHRACTALLSDLRANQA